MRKNCLLIFLLFFSVDGWTQESNCKKFTKLSCPEKYWVIFHPFVAKKALLISEQTKNITEEVKQRNILKAYFNGNGDQLDAFRHTYWMAQLTQEIGGRRARSLGKAHEKGNYKMYKKNKNEDGSLPDKAAKEMDLYNNEVGIKIGTQSTSYNLIEIVIDAILNGACKIIKVDEEYHFLDEYGNVIPLEKIKGKWENPKCLVKSIF